MMNMKKLVAALAIMAILASLLTGCTNSPEKQLKEMGYEISAQGFLQSVTKGDTAAVSLFLAAELSPDTRNEAGLTALMIAAEAGQLDVVKILVDNKAEVSAVDNESGWTALHFASTKGHAEIITLLLNSGASVEALTQSGETALMLATESERDEAVKALIEGKADVNVTRSHDGYTALHLAAAKRTPAARGMREMETCKILLEAGASPSLSTNDGTTPLMVAVKNYDYSLAKLLLERGAPVNAQNELGETAFMLLLERYGFIEIPRLLIEYGADLNIETFDGRNVLDYGTHSEASELLWSLGARESSRYRQYKEFHDTVNAGDVEKARWYIQQGLDPDVHGTLSLAVRNADREMIFMLLDEGACIDGNAHVDITPLMTAAGDGLIEMVELLLDKGADIHLTTVWGAAINVAAMDNQVATVEYLLSRGANIESEDPYGNTPLLIASSYGRLDMVRFLIAAGANINASRESIPEIGRVTALYMAEEYGHRDIAEILRAAGAK